MRGVAVLAFAGLVLCARIASAEPTRRDPAAAEALFQAGLPALDRGDWATACPKFAGSFALDPSPSALLNVAKCHAHENKIALAWADTQRALVLNQETPGEQRRKDLEAYAKKLAAELEPRLPRLRITVKPANASVARDGEPIPAAMLGEAVPVDPGAHVITASAPGFTTARRDVTSAEGATVAVDMELNPGPAGSGDAPASAGSRVPTWAWIAGGAGAACAVASVVFLIDDRSAQSDIDKNCKLPGHRCGGFDPTPDNARLRRDFDLFVGLGAAGLAGLGAGAIGVLTVPGRTEATAVLHLQPAFGGASVKGTF